MRLRRILPILLLLFCATSLVAGPLTFSFTSSLLQANRGQTVTYSATLTNTTGAPLFLNSDTVNLASPPIPDDTKFFLNFPLFLTAGQSVTAPILDVMVPLSTPVGIYPGTFTVLGGSPTDFTTNIGSATFAVQVVPEPASVGLLISGGLLLLGLRRKFPL
jgi:hypothetical protein